MDPILRSYAHTAWTPTDPLHGLDMEQKRAILLMPSTFRERFRLAPWTNREQRRRAIGEILAERRLMYDLLTKDVVRASAVPASAEPAAAVVDPYDQFRLGLHRQALVAMQAARQEQEHADRAHNPAAARDHLRRAELRHRLSIIEHERAKLNLREARLFAGDDATEVPPLAVAPAMRRERRRARER